MQRAFCTARAHLRARLSVFVRVRRRLEPLNTKGTLHSNAAL
jgi:hypothetical protein